MIFLRKYVFNGFLCDGKGQDIATQDSLSLFLDPISDVAKPDSFHQSDRSSAKIDYERPGAVPWSLLSYEGDWQQVNRGIEEETVFVSLL